MTSLASTATQSIVSHEELVGRVRELVPRLRERQERTESDRRVSDETFGELIDAELYKILLPRRYGGFEHGLDVFVDVGIEVARGCGSTGWVHSVTSMYHLFLGKFPPEAQDEVWGENPNAVMAASFPPTGTAVPVDGGYRITGNWGFCSGVDNCPWTIVGAKLPPERDGEDGKIGYALARTSDYGIEDNWDVVGLAGTGSKNVFCEDMFIPAHRFLPLEDTAVPDSPGSVVNTTGLYKIPLFATISASLCAAVMGTAQGAYDEFVDKTRGRITRGAAVSKPAPMASFPGIQLRVGEAAACIDSARLLVDRDCKDIMATVNSGRELTTEQRARNKGDLGFAAQLSTRAVDRLFEASGGGELFNAGRLQRYWRDVHAASMHISMSWDAVGALYGRITLGLPAGTAQF